MKKSDNLLKLMLKLDAAVTGLNGKLISPTYEALVAKYLSNKEEYMYLREEAEPSDNSLWKYNSVGISLLKSMIDVVDFLIRVDADKEYESAYGISSIKSGCSERLEYHRSILSVGYAGLENSKNSERLVLISEDDVKASKDYQKRLSESSERLAELEQSVTEIRGLLTSEVDKAKVLTTKTVVEMEGKKKEVNDLLGIISGTAIAGTFEESASDERSAANNFRRGAVFLMGVTFIVAVIALQQSLSHEFTWNESIFRVSMILLLSIPVAYFSRESSKHRSKYYEYKQTAIELRALDPYMASLKEDDRNRLKAEISLRLFFKDRAEKDSDESYPLNVQELVHELVRRLDKKS